MSALKQLFCSHYWNVIQSHEETYQERVHEIHETSGLGYTTIVTEYPVSNIWGQPAFRIRTKKTILLTCNKCGMTKIETL